MEESPKISDITSADDTEASVENSATEKSGKTKKLRRKSERPASKKLRTDDGEAGSSSAMLENALFLKLQAQKKDDLFNIGSGTVDDSEDKLPG